MKNENILAEWEDSFDDLGQSDESDNSDCEEICNADDGRGGYVVVEEEEIGSFSPNITICSPKKLKKGRL